MFRRTCGDLLACFLLLHARLRVRVRHPAFPAPSDFEGQTMIQNPGVMMPREGGSVPQLFEIILGARSAFFTL
jgi:hypothetical protein